MNARSFKTVFSKRLGALVAVGEHASSRGKANGAGAGGGFGGFAGFVGTLTVGFALVGLAWAGPVATALPTGGQVAQGVASISQSGALMNINQGSAKAVVNWNSFDIGAGAKVNIVQPGADAVMLNRVTGANPSQILGQLNANGQVVLVNPNGVLFGKDGSVNAISFTASTLGISDANFMAGNRQFDRNGSTASVVNQGSIKATGGYVALLGASVTNEGKIETQGGTAYLAAAETVKVPVSGSGRIKLELSPSSINAAVANAKGGTIVTEGGQVYMQAAALNSAVASILQSGSIDTTGGQGGAVHLLADGGQIKVDGSITANSTGQDDKGQQRKGGDIVIGRDEETGTLAASTDVGGAKLQSNHGFVETSGHQLTIDNTRVVAKDWLLDPDNIQITNDASLAAGYTSRVSAADLGTSLSAGTSVTIATTSGNADTGNIYINSAVSKTGNSDATLTLVADNGIIMNSAVGVTSGSGKLNLDFTANGKPGGVTPTAANTDSLGIIIGGVGNMSLNGGDLILTGTSYKNGGAGVLFQPATLSSTGAATAGTTLNISAGNITVKGTANTFSGFTGYGVFMTRYPNPVLLNASGNVHITGTITGGGTGSGFSSVYSGVTNVANSITAGGTLILRGNNRASSANTSAAVYADGGLQLRSVGNMVIQAETNNPTSAAMAFSSSANSTVHANTSFRSIDSNGNASGNVLIQSNQGGISFNNQLADATSSRDIKGVNVTIDNTGAGMTVNGVANANGGSIDASTGAITAGTGKATGTGVSGVNLGDNRTITATGNFNLYGASNANAWAVISAAKVTAANFSVQGYNSNPNGTVSGGGLQLKTGASFTGTATSGSNLIKGTWGASQFGSTYGLLVGDSSSSNISLTSAAGSTLSVEGYNNMTSVAAGYLYYSPGLHTQGTVNTSGTLTLKGYSQVHHGLAINGTLTHTGGALTLDGTSQPFSGYPANVGSSAGVQLNGILNVNGVNNLTVTGTNKTTNSSNQSGSTAFGVNTASGSQLNGSGGTLSITGLTPMNSGLTAANLPKTQAIYSAGSISGWGNTTLLGQNAANSSLSAVQVMGNINVGNSQLNVLANGGQIYQGSGSTFTASRITLDNTGAGRTSLFTDYSVTPNIALNASYSGNIDVNGKVTMGSAATTSSSATRGLDLNGAMTTTGDINLATNSGAYINSALTSSAGDINAQAKLTIETAKALSAPTTSGVSGGNITLTTTGGDIIEGADITAGKIVSLDNSSATGKSIIRTAGIISGDTVNIKTYNQIGAEDVASPAATNRIQVSANNLSMSSAGYQYVTGNKSMTVAAQSTGGGSIKIKTTAGNIAVGTVNNINSISTTGTVDLNAAAAISASQAISATNLYMTAGSTIGSSDSRVQTNASSLYASSGGNHFITDTNATGVNVAAQTTANNGSVDIATTNGTLNVGTVNGLSGISAKDSGNISLVGNNLGATGDGIRIAVNITAAGGTVTLTGTTAAGTPAINNAPYAGIYNSKTVTGKEIVLTAKATNTSSNALGYYGAGGSLTATNTLRATGSTASSNQPNSNGFYMWGGGTTAGGALTIEGASNTSAIAFDNGATVKSTSGSVSIIATNGDIKSGGGSNVVEAKGDVLIKAGTDQHSSGEIDGTTLTVTQVADSTGSTIIQTTGKGSVKTPKVINNGTGKVIVAAGSSIAAGDGSGGQVLTVAGNTITNSTGKTYVYTGLATGTGALSNLSVFGTDLYLSTIGSNTKNAASNTAFETNGTRNTIAGGANAQVMFREKLAFNAPLNLNDATLNYGNTDNASVQAALQRVNPATSSNSTMSSQAGNLNISNNDLIADALASATMNSAMAIAANKSTSGNLRVSTTPYAVDMQGNNYTLSGITANLRVNPLTLNASIGGVQTTYGIAAGAGSVQLAGVLGADVVSASASIENSAYSSSGNLKAGTYTQSASGALQGADAGNYTFSGTSSANYVVSKRALDTLIAGVSTTYGTAAATGVASVSGVLSGDKVDLGNAKATLVNALYSSSGQVKAGTYKQTVANGLTGADADNYTAAPTSVANYVVTPKAIAATVTAADKVYDGNNIATLNANSADILSGDVVNVTGVTGTFASKNVVRDASGNVIAQTVTVAGAGVSLGGADGANYTLTNATSIAATTARITPKDLTVSGITAADKAYDGNTTAALNTSSAVLSGVVAGDGVSVSSQSAVGNFASKNVAFGANGAVTSQAVTVSSLSLNGQDAGNYTVTDKSAIMAKVLQRALSITGSVAQDKTVDGTTLAQVKPGQLSNLVAGESLVVTATGQFADAEIGTNKAVSTQYALANGSNGIAKNYTAPPAEVLRAAILAANTNPLQPIINPSKPGGGGRVVIGGSSSSGAALGVAEDEDLTNREECSILNPEKCECQESTIAGVELCFAPGMATNTKD